MLHIHLISLLVLPVLASGSQGTLAVAFSALGMEHSIHEVTMAVILIALIALGAFGLCLINFGGVPRNRRLALVAAKNHLPAAANVEDGQDEYLLTVLTERKLTELHVPKAIFDQVAIGNPVRVSYAEGRFLKRQFIIEVDTDFTPQPSMGSSANEKDFAHESAA
jgi:hypothetical protein